MQAVQALPMIRVLLAGAESRSRLHLRRLLSGSPDLEIVGHVRAGASVEEAVQRTGASIVLADAADDRATAMAVASAAARLRLPVLVLTGDSPVLIQGERFPTLARPATMEAELPGSVFGKALLIKLRSLGSGTAVPAHAAQVPLVRHVVTSRPLLIAIGSSTGGPQALPEVLQRLAGRVRQPVVITQHMPATFTTMLAEHVTRRTGLETVQAADGMLLQPGRAYLAPGGRHLLVQRQGDKMTCQLDDGPPENFCKPAVDPMLRSLVAATGGKAMAVILTGMGHDGLQGCQALNAAGGIVLAQDEATSVVWGMPGAVAQAGLCRAVLPLNRIGDEILALGGATA
jgi:two-component system, chemotaxis family, protein-glutamate methylesterase/glutaminase